MNTRFILMPYPGSRRPFLSVLLASLAVWVMVFAVVDWVR